MWNNLANDVVETDIITGNTFKNRLDKHWSNEDVLFNFNANLIGPTNLYVQVMLSRFGQRGLPAPVKTHWTGLD